MSRARTTALIGVLLAALAVLVSVAPAAAHPVSSVAAPVEPTPSAPSTPPPPSLESIAPWVVAGALLLAATVACRRPRRLLVVALVLLLTVFAFENALHSVHHGFDAKPYDECTIAAASAHLSAVSVDGVVETSVVLALAGRTAEPDLSLPSSRPLGPDQGRAPPFPAA